MTAPVEGPDPAELPDEAEIEERAEHAGVDLTRAQPAAGIDRVGLDRRGAVRPCQPHRRADQRAQQPGAAMGAGGDEAGDRPHRQVVDRLDVAHETERLAAHLVVEDELRPESAS